MNVLQDARCEGSVMSAIEEMHALRIARALGDPVRFSIYRHIVEMNEMRCGDICAETPVRASTVSHHLKTLSETGLIESRREGQGVYYRLVPATLTAYLNYLRNLLRKGQSSRMSVSRTVVRSSKVSSKTTRTAIQPAPTDMR